MSIKEQLDIVYMTFHVSRVGLLEKYFIYIDTLVVSLVLCLVGIVGHGRRSLTVGVPINW